MYGKMVQCLINMNRNIYLIIDDYDVRVVCFEICLTIQTKNYI